MGLFAQVLTESKKTYEFKVGVAGTLDENFTDSLETCLKKFDVNSVSNGKKTPIQERPLDFPQLQNMEVTYYEVSLNYPTTPKILEEYIENCCPCDPNHVIVRNMNDDREQEEYYVKNEPYESKLETEELEQADENAQATVGTSKVMDLLKELETARKERNIDPMEGATQGENTGVEAMDKETNNKAVVGG